MCLCKAQSIEIKGDSISVPFRLVDNRIFLEVDIENKTGQFVLDTGGYFIMDNSFTRTVGIPLGNQFSTGGAGADRVPAWRIFTDRLTIDSLVIKNISGMALDLSPILNGLNLPFLDGVIGVELFRRFTVGIDFIREEVHFYEPTVFTSDSSWYRIPFTFYQNRLPVIQATFDGMNGTFIIDTGDRFEVTLFKNFARSNHINSLYELSDTVVTGYGIGGPLPSRTAYLNSFTLTNPRDLITVDSVTFRIPLLSSGVFTRIPHSGSIGNGLLKKFNYVIFDYHNGLMYIKQDS